jgi:hypothetical protein
MADACATDGANVQVRWSFTAAARTNGRSSEPRGSDARTDNAARAPMSRFRLCGQQRKKALRRTRGSERERVHERGCEHARRVRGQVAGVEVAAEDEVAEGVCAEGVEERRVSELAELDRNADGEGDGGAHRDPCARPRRGGEPENQRGPERVAEDVAELVR